MPVIFKSNNILLNKIFYFRCCLFVTELERRLYKSRQVDKMRMTTQLKQYTAKLKWKLNQAREGQTTGSDDLDLSTATFGGLDEDR